MLIALDDKRWSELQTAYHQPCDDLLAWLQTAYNGELTSDLLGDIINDIQHQGDTSTSMYGVAPHLLELATRYNAEMSRELVVHSGLVYASSTAHDAMPCPSSIADEFGQSAKRGLELAAALLIEDFDDTWFKYLLAAIAGFAGHGRIGRFLEGIEFTDEGIWCPYLDDPISDIESDG
jgi:hypothetical protein